MDLNSQKCFYTPSQHPCQTVIFKLLGKLSPTPVLPISNYPSIIIIPQIHLLSTVFLNADLANLCRSKKNSPIKISDLVTYPKDSFTDLCSSEHKVLNIFKRLNLQVLMLLLLWLPVVVQCIIPELPVRLIK